MMYQPVPRSKHTDSGIKTSQLLLYQPYRAVNTLSRL